MNFRSIADLNSCIARNVWRLPKDLSLVVGVPRSGLLAANILSLQLNLPLTDIDGFLANRILGKGRRPLRGVDFEWSSIERVLIVDDSVASGYAMREVRERIRAASVPYECVFLAVYAMPESPSVFDISFETVASPRLFEWNFMHHPHLGECCVDIDGVLCHDPTSEENDDGERYMKFLVSARPLHIPTQTVHSLVTNRLEKYREPTEAWLNKQGIKYKSLRMLDLPNKEERLRRKPYVSFKSDVYIESGCRLFIESDLSQSLGIADRTGRQVFCVSEMSIVNPSMKAMVKGIAAKSKRKIARRASATATFLGKWMLERLKY